MCLMITMEQINEAALGLLEDAAALAHLETCPLCRIELDLARADLALFEQEFRESERRANWRLN